MTREHPLTVGVVTPHAASGPEVELPAMTGGRVTAVVARTRSPAQGAHPAARHARSPHAELLASTEPAALDRAAAIFAGSTLAAVAHASTTSGYLLGPREEAALVARLAERFDVPAVASCAAAVAALRTHGVGRLQLVHPPWFDDEFDALGVAYFRGHGFSTVATRVVGLPGDPAGVDPRHVVDLVEHHVEDGAEAVFLAGNGFRAAGAVEALEARTGRLVIAANHALLWAVLAATGTPWTLPGHGRLLRERPR